jgi:DNA-directed RNA polymerase specialized sigma24 family protein
MLNCRSIPPEKWLHARKALVYFFSRRGASNPEDLAQETLMTVWSRDDYQFEQEDDFLKVCYGFAKNILLEGYRVSRKQAAEGTILSVESHARGIQGLEGNEARVFLEEVCRRADAELREEEWAAIQAAVDRDQQDQPVEGKQRVRLYRARKKLAKLTGWHN